MAIDTEIETAIYAIAEELDQPRSVAKRLIAWLEDESNRDLPHADALEHLQNLRNAIQVTED